MQIITFPAENLQVDRGASEPRQQNLLGLADVSIEVLRAELRHVPDPEVVSREPGEAAKRLAERVTLLGFDALPRDAIPDRVRARALAAWYAGGGGFGPKVLTRRPRSNTGDVPANHRVTL